MSWTRVSVEVDGEAAEAVAEALRPFAHGGVSLEQNVSQAGEEPITVSIFLPVEQDTPAKRRRIEEILWYMGRLYPIPSPLFATVREEDWADAWKRHFKPLRLGQRTLICPLWEPPEPRPDDIVILMDPGMAFGTGLHPSTQMCLEVIEAQVRPGMSVLDVGTGSGILAIAAARLGARPILALDNDPVAVEVALQNCVTNGVQEVVQVLPGSLVDLPPGRGWDLVLVNILAPVILQLIAEGLGRHLEPGGLIVLSGIIEEQAAEVLAVLEQDHTLVERRLVGDWVSFVGRRPK